MSRKKTSEEETIRAIHEALEEAQYRLTQLGERLQFLIGPDGSIRVVRRDKTGETAWPKAIFAELSGCDPMFWRPEYPEWLRSLDPGRALAAAAGDGSGRLPSKDGMPTPGGPKAPTPSTQDD